MYTSLHVIVNHTTDSTKDNMFHEMHSIWGDIKVFLHHLFENSLICDVSNAYKKNELFCPPPAPSFFLLLMHSTAYLSFSAEAQTNSFFPVKLAIVCHSILHSILEKLKSLCNDNNDTVFFHIT